MTNQFIEDILTTAFEGGSNYWIDEIKTTKDVAGTKYFSEVVGQGGELAITADDDDKVYPLTRSKIVKGIHFALSGQQIRDEDYDGDDADNALQFALFGEVVYG